jgi:hypothetical protein
MTLRTLLDSVFDHPTVQNASISLGDTTYVPSLYVKEILFRRLQSWADEEIQRESSFDQQNPQNDGMGPKSNQTTTDDPVDMEIREEPPRNEVLRGDRGRGRSTHRFDQRGARRGSRNSGRSTSGQSQGTTSDSRAPPSRWSFSSPRPDFNGSSSNSRTAWYRPFDVEASSSGKSNSFPSLGWSALPFSHSNLSSRNANSPSHPSGLPASFYHSAQPPHPPYFAPDLTFPRSPFSNSSPFHQGSSSNDHIDSLGSVFDSLTLQATSGSSRSPVEQQRGNLGQDLENMSRQSKKEVRRRKRQLKSLEKQMKPNLRTMDDDSMDKGKGREENEESDFSSFSFASSKDSE